MDQPSQDVDIENKISLLINDVEEPFDANDSDNTHRPHLLEAGIVYILLPKDVPITRTTRIQWLLDHINTVITISTKPNLNFNSNELEIISVVSVEDSPMPCSSYLVTTCTEVIFLAQSYRFIYCLDMSPSQSAVDVQQGEILFDEIINCFKVSLEGLCQEFTIPGCPTSFHPRIYLTVIVNTPFFISPAQQVLVKGVQVSSHNMKQVIDLVQQHFLILEGRIAHVSALAYDQIDSQILENEGMVGALFDIIDNERIANIPMVSPDANFVNMLRYSMLAISLLPKNSLSHILVITDGVVAMPDSNVMESLLYQLHYDGISLSFLKVGSSFHPHSSAGYVSYTDLLHFLSHTTLGSYLESFPVCSSEDSEMNIYHKLYLLWTFHSKSKYMTPLSVINQQNWIMPNEKSYTTRVPTLLSKKQTEEKINASLLLLITRRMREGYSIVSINYNNGILEIKLSLHWKTFIFIHYVVKAQWPIVKNVTHVEVHISAPYDFLHDITCMMKKETKSSYRQAVFERFWIRLTQLASNDTVLAQQLSSFQNANTWYTLPESVRSGIPVFILSNNAQCYDMNKLFLLPSDSSSPKFLSVWQPICQIESNNWRKWFHTHKLTLILKHDHPLPKHIHTANSSGRFQIIQCRQAASALYALLADWTSFILIDNHTYLKLLYKDHDKPPVWFCIIRVSSKFPCTTINMGFLTGTPGYVRYKVCAELRKEVKELSYLSTTLKSKENLCCVLLQKPLEKILIRYERMPTDFYTVVFPDGTQPPQGIQTLPISPFAGTLFTTLSRYLFHQRWIWSATYVCNTKLNDNALSRILSTITRIRLKEGFHFAHSSSGIVTMVLELKMEPPNASCVVQYVLFPPHSTWLGERDTHSGSEEEAEQESELDYELQMVTEVWIEPQYGNVQTSSDRLKYMNNIPYYKIAEVIRLVDMKCINSLLTLEHLSLMCQEKSKDSFDEYSIHTGKRNRHRYNSNSRANRLSISESVPTNSESKSQWSPCFVQRIQHIPFQFDPIEILPVCQQTELLFSMFVEGRDKYGGFCNKDPEKTNKLLLENMQNHLLLMHDCEIDIAHEESAKFTRQIIDRHKNKAPHMCPITHNITNFTVPDCSSQWRCFAKGISVTHVILTFVPATLEDLKALMKYEPENCPTVTSASTSTSTENLERASSQASNYSEVPINNANSLALPMYVFDCPLALLVDSFINNSETGAVPTRDVYEDHRYKFGVIVQEESINLKTDDSENVSPEPKSDESDVEQRSSVKHHCKALVLTHSKCFAMSLFSALHFGAFVHCSDVQSAMDQCEETVYEIDITNYIQTICAHIKHSDSETVPIQELRKATPCLQLKPLHRLIKEKFFEITNVAFNPIPSNKEFYYCRNLTYERADIQHNDSDDEISNPPSELIEFKEISLSTEAPSNYVSNKNQSDDFQSEISPLFLHFICTIRYDNNVANASVKVLPTCLGELIQHFDSSVDSIVKSKLQISLDVLCLTLPMDVQNVINDYSNKGLRTTSFCSDGFQPSIGSSISEASFNSDYKEPEPLLYIPDLQKKAINTLCDEIKWLLKDEIATSLLDIEPVTFSTLDFVMKHVSSSTNRNSCILDVIALHFVYGSSQSYETFVQEFAKIVIPDYKLLKQDEIYYLAKNHEAASDNKDFDTISTSTLDKDYQDLITKEICDNLTAEDFDAKCHLLHKSELFASQSDLSSINGSVAVTEGGYDEDVSDCEEDYEWLIDLNNKRPNLPNFWLIMQIDQDAVTIYFHCRFLELTTTHVGLYLEVQRAIRDAIRDMCKRVNQSLLLQSLHDTRTCDHLLEPDDNFTDWHAESTSTQLTKNLSFSRLKSMDEISDESEPYPTALIEASLKFTTGYFSCPVVFETPFFLHPRLKTGPGKSGMFALKSVLDKFSVTNRSNMFVYQDKDSHVFYLRLHENLQTGYCRSFKSSEFEQPVSRSPSIASLPLSQQKSNLTRSDYSISSANSEIRPRVRSFGEKETKDTPVEDTIVLRVHGITKTGEDVRCDLVQVLQNRLDDAVLDFLSVMLARNSMCPLTPEDVRFLQKPFKPPEVIIRLSIQECALKLLNPFTHYLRQNLLQFLNIPKYTDARSSSHFKDYTQSDQSNKLSEDNIFIYNQSQSPSAGNRGIACIALAIIDKTENYSDQSNIDIEFIFSSKKFEEIVCSNVLNDDDELPDTYLEIRLWKQGRVNIDNLRNKLCNATSQATWDIIMEYFLLKVPLCERSSANRALQHLNTLQTEFSFVPTSCKETPCKVLLDTSNEDNSAATFMKENVEVPHRSRKGTMNSQTHRSITFDDIKDKEKEKSSLDWRTCIKFDSLELGDDGVVTAVYSKVLKSWLEFGFEINTPSIRKTVINLTYQHLLNIVIKELQNLIVQLSHDACKFFTLDLSSNDADVYVPYVYSHFSRKCLVISRNFEQWKGSSYFRGSLDFPDLLSSHNLKHMQKFLPIVVNDKQFIPRQKILWGTIKTNYIILYTYNWSKDNVDKLTEYGKNIGLWLSVRASALNSITTQKLGLFHNQAISRKSTFSANNPYLNNVGDVDSITRFSKERSKRVSGSHNVSSSTLEAFKDAYGISPVNNIDPVIAFTMEMCDIKKSERKCRDELKKLHCMYQSRTNTCTYAQMDILLQNSRVIHYCHTPLLFLPRWRIQSAATRDHSIHSPKVSAVCTKGNDTWHETLCSGFIAEYKKYLQTLGFMSLNVENKKSSAKHDSPYNSIVFIQKTILGGILVFTIQLNEPFFITKLHAIECNRLQSTNSRTSINQFTQSFIDECDRIKILMHLHSFTYDFHLRCIYNYVSNNHGVKVTSGYLVTQFLDDFMKYYNKAPNYARNLIHSDTISINNLKTEGKQLFSYLISNVAEYNFIVFKMQQDSRAEISEYVLVQVSNTPQVSYKDSQDRQHTDDFDVTLIVSNINNPNEHSDNNIHLKYYLILTSRREIFPKSEVERKLGKFRTVSSTRSRLSFRISECENTRSTEEIKSSKEKSVEISSENSNDDHNSISTDASTAKSSKEKSIQSSHIEIKQESVNYLGYYSSHEQLMQQLILDCANATQKKIGDMVMQGMLHCRTHLLWNKLIHHQDSNQLTYEEFIELTNFSKVENLCDLNTNLTSLLVHQPLTWYQGLTKLLLSKYHDQRRSYISPDGNVQHHVMLHPGYVGAFMMLKMDLHTNRGDLYAVYRNSHKFEDSDACLSDRKTLLDGFINCVL